MSDVLHLEIRFTNTSTNTLYFSDEVCWNPQSLLSIQIFNARGKELQGHSDFVGECLLSQPAGNSIGHYLALRPKAFISVTDQFKMDELVPVPGEYVILVHSISGFSGKGIAALSQGTTLLPMRTADYPNVFSNRTRIFITDDSWLSH